VLGALNIPGIMPSKIFNTKTDRAFANIFAPGGVIFLRPAAFKKPRWRFAYAFVYAFVYAFAYDSKKKGSPEAPNFN
jgi:hypothetical protein